MALALRIGEEVLTYQDRKGEGVLEYPHIRNIRADNGE